MPNVSRMRDGMTATSLMGARSTKNTPSGYPSATSAASCRDSRVLPGPAGTGEGQDPGRGQQSHRLGQLPVPPDEAGEQFGEIVRDGIQGAEERKLGLQARGHDLEDCLRL